MPKLSVIIPVYGVEKYIERCARSLFEQTLDDIEYLFIDDCTPDRSIDVLKKLMEDYPQRQEQVVIHRMEKNSGQAMVRRWGMQNATGDYVIHCDSDDWIHTEMYKTMYDEAKQGNYDIVRCDFLRTDGHRKIRCDKIPESAYTDNLKLISYALIGYSLTSLCDKLIKRSVFENNEIVFPTNNMQEDAVLVIQALYHSKRIRHLSYTYYFYYINPTSISRTTNEEASLKRLKDVCESTDVIVDFLNRKNVGRLLSEEIVCRKYIARSHLIELVKTGNYYKEWYNTYPEIEGHVLFNRKMRLYDKLYYYGVKTKILPFIEKLRSHY